ncbi:MAG: hypothetical protein Q9159_003387 [Coniocarpon cinnabarinum]
MKFVSTQDRDQFGRRHKVDRSAHHQQHESDGRRLRVPSIRNDLAFPIQRDDEVFDAGSLKIKIGDEALSSMWNTDINTYRANVGDEVEEDDFYGNVQVGTPHRNRHTSWESQDMLDTSSFHGFSDQSSHLRSRLRKLDSELSPFASPAAGVPFESEPADEVACGRLIFSSSCPATPPALDAQSNVAVASIPPRALTALSRDTHPETVGNQKAPGSSRSLAAEEHCTELASNTRNDPMIISSSSSSTSARRTEEREPEAGHCFAKTNSAQPTASPSTSYRQLMTLAALPRADNHTPADRHPAQPALSESEAMWRAFVFGSISPSRVSTAESVADTSADPLCGPFKSTGTKLRGVCSGSSLEARASTSLATDTKDDSSLISKDSALQDDCNQEARTDVVTQLAGDMSPSPKASSTNFPSDGDTKHALLTRHALQTVQQSSSPDPLSGPTPSVIRKITFSPPKRFTAPATATTVDTGRDVVHLGKRTSERLISSTSKATIIDHIPDLNHARQQSIFDDLNSGSVQVSLCLNSVR